MTFPQAISILIVMLLVAILTALVLLWREHRALAEKLRQAVRNEARLSVKTMLPALEEERTLMRDERAKHRTVLRDEVMKGMRKEIVRALSDLTRNAHKAAMATGQQMEWRAHLCQMLDLPIGALPATRGWAASPDLLVHLATIILEDRPGVIVECGCGVSTLVAARAVALAGQGHVHSLEAVPDFAALTRLRLAALGLSAHATILDAPLAPLPEGGGEWYPLPLLSRIPERIGLLFVDGPQVTETSSRAPALDHILPRLAPGGICLFDDARRTEEGSFADTIAARWPDWQAIHLPAEKGAVCFRKPG